jgi:MscS family membrane protein
MNRCHHILMEAQRQNISSPGIFTPDSVKQMAQQAKNLFERGVYCLELGKIPPTLRKAVSYEAALTLKEILDRIDLPPFDLIPDADAIEKEAEEKRFPKLFRWRIPNTDIVIARVEEGPRRGEYLFAAETIDRLDKFWSNIRDLPSRTDAYTSDGFLVFYTSSPGWLLPPKWSQWLPAWSKRMYRSLAVWQWFAYVTVLLLGVLLVIVIYRRLLLRAVSLPPATRSWRRLLFFLVSTVALTTVHYILTDYVNITGTVLIATRLVFAPIWWFLFGAGVFSVAMALAETIIASPKIDPEGIQASYFRAVFGLTGFVVGASVLIYGLSRLGVSLVPLLTGLGIGGLAVALAARPTLEGIISSFTIFADKPYGIGDRVNVRGHKGIVESIGLRSTRIRLWTGHVTSIPNEQMVALEIENIARRPFIRREFDVTIIYGTPPVKIKRAVDILREILAVPEGQEQESHPNEAINKPDFPTRVFFNNLNEDSLNIYVSYWYHPPEWWKYMEHAHWVNLQIMERFNAEGIEFAFPTQTLHLAGKRKRPVNVGQRQIPDEKAT